MSLAESIENVKDDTDWQISNSILAPTRGLPKNWKCILVYLGWMGGGQKKNQNT